MHKALDLGITLFDTADVYGGRGTSETFLGKALGDKRKDIVLATKFGGPMGNSPLERGASRRYVFAAVEASLRRLGTDYIDLYQLHFPDAETPIEETLGALDDVVRQGKVRYIGCSNFAGWQLIDANHIAQQRGFARFISAQNHYNLLERTIRHELLPACTHAQVGVLPYFPLASGLLTGKYQRGQKPGQDTRLGLWGERAGALLSDRSFDKVEALDGVRARARQAAARAGVRLAAVAAADLERDRRRDASRSAREQRQGRRLSPDRRRYARARAAAVTPDPIGNGRWRRSRRCGGPRARSRRALRPRHPRPCDSAS